jgi:cytochrome P450
MTEINEELASAFDPITPEFTADQHKALRELREKCPVAHSSQFGGFWALTRRADVIEAASNHKQLINSVMHVVPGGLAGNSRPLLHSDQPEHTLYKNTIQTVLLSSRLKADVVESVRAEARKIIASILEKGEGDLVLDYGGPLMAHTIISIFGIEGVDPHELDQIIHSYVVAGRVRNEADMKAANEKLENIAKALIADRTEHPRNPDDDLTTAILRDHVAGKLTDPAKVMGAVRQPFAIVWIATSHSLSNMFRRLLIDRGLQDTLRGESSLIADSVDEFLRMDQPQLGFARTANSDLEIGGQRIREGDPVALVFPVANRDPEVFEDPETFKIGRYPNPHLAFGAGIHSCPGKNIAREVVQVALEELITGTGDFTLTIPVEDIPNEYWPFRASLSLPVRVAPPASACRPAGAA